VFRAAGETETTQDWLQLDEGDPGFEFLVLYSFESRLYSDF
jgi:hypothetical protein